MELKWLSQAASSVMAAVNLSQEKPLRKYQKDDSFHLGRKVGLGRRLISVASTEMVLNFCLELLHRRDTAEIFCKFFKRFSNTIQ